MARTITVDDDDTGTQVKVTIERNGSPQAGVTFVLVHAHGRHLPDELLSALVPWIGLPSTEARHQPKRHNHELPDRNGGALSPPPAAVNPPAPTSPAAPPPSAVFRPAEPPAPEPAAKPAPPAPTPAAGPQRRTGKFGGYANKPTHEQLTETINKIGASPKNLAAHYRVPTSAMNNWLAAWRKRNAEAVAEPGA